MRNRMAHARLRRQMHDARRMMTLEQLAQHRAVGQVERIAAHAAGGQHRGHPCVL
jgi:hypothetical protein